MKGTIASLPDCEKNTLGTLKDKESGNIVEFEAGYFLKLAVGQEFNYEQVVQKLDGGKDKKIGILKKRLPA